MYPYDVFVVRQRLLDEMIEWCESNSVTSFAYLLSYASENNWEWFKILCSVGGCKYMVKYFKRINGWTGAF